MFGNLRGDGRGGFQDLRNSPGADLSLRIHHKHQAEQHYRKHHVEQIIHKRDQLADLKRILINQNTGNPVDQHTGQIHQQEKDRLSHRHQFEKPF